MSYVEIENADDWDFYFNGDLPLYRRYCGGITALYIYWRHPKNMPMHIKLLIFSDYLLPIDEREGVIEQIVAEYFGLS